MKKICRKCKKEKTISNFYKSKLLKSGYRNECKECCRKLNLGYKHSRPGRYLSRKYHLKSLYNITVEQYDQMFEQQNGVCIICGGINSDGRRLCVDHNHKTGRIRGLICFPCNQRIEWYIKYKNDIKKYLQPNRRN